MRIAWLTDLHLNFVEAGEVSDFLASVATAQPDAVLIGGDIAEARDVEQYLEQIDEALPCPVYFVLGNHDFYFGSIYGVRRRMAHLCRQRPKLHYLTSEEVCEITPTVGLIGHDGWADARLGDYQRSLVMMNDYRLVAELSGMEKEARWPVLQAMGDEAAEHIREVLPAALDLYPHVLLLTHVPPFREACWHQGRLSDDEWLPHFSCKAVGNVLLDTMRRRPNRQLTVFCGHTHGCGQTQPLENLLVLTGGATYGAPEIQRVFDVA